MATKTKSKKAKKKNKDLQKELKKTTDDAIKSVKSTAESVQQDLADAAGYTIEQAKQQLEEDALQAAAEEKKLGVRELLARCAAPQSVFCSVRVSSKARRVAVACMTRCAR